jgi:hypothetical protein
MLPGGFLNDEIKMCCDHAMKEGLYDCVQYHSEGTERGTKTAKAYACSNEMEYSAELSTAFLGGLDEKEEYNK